MASSQQWGYKFVKGWERNFESNSAEISLVVPVKKGDRRATILALAQELHHVLYGELIPDEDLRHVEELLGG